ncbi:MAG: hypothetical protein E4G94_05505 [ANME-2 cluster archaeon]|nr:MAG: hypothetical protein E4G94_05505 [ANME-2 cluster archaeon]
MEIWTAFGWRMDYTGIVDMRSILSFDWVKRSDIWSFITIVVLIVIAIPTILATYEIYYMSEEETHPNLIISQASPELTYDRTRIGFNDIIIIEPTISIYNTKRSDYPARLILVKGKILDDNTEQVIVGDKHIPMTGGDAVIDSGENTKFSTQIQMELNKTGNYTTLIAIEYVDLKDYTRQSIDLCYKFEVKEQTNGNQILYEGRLKEVGDFNELWAIGKEC